MFSLMIDDIIVMHDRQLEVRLQSGPSTISWTAPSTGQTAWVEIHCSRSHHLCTAYYVYWS